LEKIISANGILENIHYYRSQYFFDLEEIIFENFNNSENNMKLKEKICFKMNFFFPGFFFPWWYNCPCMDVVDYELEQ